MNKLNYEHQVLTMPFVSQSDIEPARRLIVLVLDLEADLTFVVRRVWELANATGAHVDFIGLYSDPTQELRLRRELVTLSAMVNYGRVSAETEVIFGRDWVGAVKSRWQAGDLVVCLDEKPVGLSHKPLSQILQSDLDVPLYILSGLDSKNNLRSNWLSQVIAWLSAIAIIFGFFVLQASIYHLAKDWLQTIILLLTIPAELWTIWVWNNLFK